MLKPVLTRSTSVNDAIAKRLHLFLNALKKFESTLRIGCSIQDLDENIANELFFQRLNPDDSLKEVLFDLTETFNSEEKRLLRVNNAKTAELNFFKFFGDNGVHPGRKFIKTVSFCHQVRCFILFEKPDLMKLPRVRKNPIPDSETHAYRRLAKSSCTILMIRSRTLSKYKKIWIVFAAFGRFAVATSKITKNCVHI